MRGSTWNRGVWGTSRGSSARDPRSNDLWNGGPRLGYNATGSGPPERRYEDYQPNLEPNVFCEAPPEIRSVPPPAPAPAPSRPRPVYNPNHVPGLSRGRGRGKGSLISYQGSSTGRPAYQGSTYQGSSHQGSASQSSAYQGSTPRGSSSRGSGYRGSAPRGSVVRGFASGASAAHASGSQNSAAPGEGDDGGTRSKSAAPREADNGAPSKSASRGAADEAAGPQDSAIHTSVSQTSTTRDEADADARRKSANSEHSEITKNETKWERSERLKREKEENEKRKREKREKHEENLRQIQQRKQEKEDRKAERARAKQERENQKEEKEREEREDRKAAKRVASQSIASGSTENGARAQSHGQSSMGGKDLDRSQERTVQRPSGPQGGITQDERKGPAQTTPKHSEISSANKEERGSTKPEEGRRRYDDSPAIVIGSSSSETRFPTEPASGSQADRWREARYNLPRTQQRSLPPSQPPNRWNLNISSSNSENSSLPMDAASSSTRPVPLSRSYNGRQDTAIPVRPHANGNYLKWQDPPQPSMAQTTNNSSSNNNAVASSSAIPINESDARPRHHQSGPPRSFSEDISRKRRREEMSDMDDIPRPRPSFAAHVSQPRSPQRPQADGHRYRPPSMFAAAGRQEQRNRPILPPPPPISEDRSPNPRNQSPDPPARPRAPLYVPSTTYFNKPATTNAFTFAQLRSPQPEDSRLLPNRKIVKQVRKIHTPPPASEASFDGMEDANEDDPLEVHLSAALSRNGSPIFRRSDYGSARSQPMSSAELPEASRQESHVDTPMRVSEGRAMSSLSNAYTTALSTSSAAQKEARILNSMLPDLAVEINEKRSDDGMGDDDDEAFAESREQKAGAEFFPMPPDCDRHKKIGKDRLIENRSKFVRAQTIKLENDCKVVQRALWRADGLALDWALNGEKGVYREFWPVDDCDRSKFAKEVAKRCRLMGEGRKILSTTTKRDAVEVSWSAESQEGPPPAPNSAPKDSSKDVTSTKKSKQAIKQKTRTEKQTRPPAAVSVPPVTSSTTGGVSAIPLAPTDQHAEETAQSSFDAEVQECLKQGAKWLAIRASAKNDVERAFAQERMDQYAKKIENIYARKG